MKIEKLSIWLLVIGLAVVLFNSFQISQLGVQGVTGAAVAGTAAAGLSLDVIPNGVPEIYGKELKVSYDDVTALNPQLTEATISKLGNLDTSITLQGDELKRYIGIVSKISCEYCCGAQSIIFSNGQAACGCAHSYAMRGVAKYLITKHGPEFSDDEILEELGKWKTLFFPSQLSQKAKMLAENGIELNYINLASNKYRGAETGAGGGMVGGC